MTHFYKLIKLQIIAVKIKFDDFDDRGTGTSQKIISNFTKSIVTSSKDFRRPKAEVIKKCLAVSLKLHVLWPSP
jgi:hypothetical protein